jgi:flagellar L-ring protein precursor FlgH
MRFLLLAFVFLPLAASAQSLYQEGSFRPLTADHRAYQAGDTLTVLIVESASASSTADTTTEKRAALGGSVGTTTRTEKATIGLNEDFTGKGRIQRSGRLLAQITVRVTEVAPNGDLVVAGQQLIEVNEEKQEIKLDGRVRPVDVNESNTVLSTRLADAKILYIGDGLLGEKQRPGIITRFLSWLRIL